MKQYTLPGGSQITDGPFSIAIGEAVYSFPQNWLTLATAEDLAHWGITVEELPDPVPEPVQVTLVTAAQAKLVLDDDGIYADVEAVCLAHPVTAVRIFWESANVWEMNNPYVQAIGAEFNLNEAAIADMFNRASLK